jgi:hypothetical protein
MGLIVHVTLVVHQTPTLNLCNKNLCISLGSSADRYMLFWVICGCFGKTTPIGNVIQQWIIFTTADCFTESVTEPYCNITSCLLEFLHDCKFVGFEWSNFVAVAACTDDFDALVSCDNCIQELTGSPSTHTPVPCNVLQEHIMFVVTAPEMNPLFQIC